MFEYWKSKLSGNELRAYESLRSAIVNENKQADLNKIKDTEIIHKIYAYFLNDHPELYSVHYALGIAITLLGSTALINYIYSRADKMKIDAYKSSYMKGICALSSLDSVSAELKVVEKLVLETERVIDNEKNQNAMSAIFFKKAQCSGFAKAFKFCMDELKIWCIVVNGQVSDSQIGGPHSWNIINLNGKYYHVDVTMMGGANVQKKQPLIYHMINCSDEKMEKQGYVWDKNLTPPCTEDMDLSPYSVVQLNATMINGASSSQNGKVLHRLFDLNGLITDALKNRQTLLQFTLDVPQYSAEKLSQMVANVFKEKANLLNVMVAFQIKAIGKNFEIKIAYI